MASDFNARLSTTDRNGGAVSGEAPCSLFRSWYQCSSMVDFGYQGPQFTWARHNLKVRLDRVFGNNKWFDMFPQSVVLHLPKFHSDHRPILLKLEESMLGPRQKPFRFLNAWVTDSISLTLLRIVRMGINLSRYISIYLPIVLQSGIESLLATLSLRSIE